MFCTVRISFQGLHVDYRARIYKKMYEFRQRQQDLQTKMQEHSNADEKFNLTLVTVLELAKNAGRLFKSSSVDEKRQLLIWSART